MAARQSGPVFYRSIPHMTGGTVVIGDEAPPALCEQRLRVDGVEGGVITVDGQDYNLMPGQVLVFFNGNFAVSDQRVVIQVGANCKQVVLSGRHGTCSVEGTNIEHVSVGGNSNNVTVKAETICGSINAGGATNTMNIS